MATVFFSNSFSFKFLALLVLAAFPLGMSSQSARAASLSTIDFESGFVEGQAVSSIDLLDNVVTFSRGANNRTPPIIAEVGPDRFGFAGPNGPDTVRPGATARVGSFFLTDTRTTAARRFNFQFLNPISSLSLDFLDLDTGDNARLEVFSDSTFTNLLGSSSIVGPGRDGAVQNLSIDNLLQPILSAWIIYDNDGGVGVDNIQFETLAEDPRADDIPEPLSILGSVTAFLLGGEALRRRKPLLQQN